MKMNQTFFIRKLFLLVFFLKISIACSGESSGTERQTEEKTIVSEIKDRKVVLRSPADFRKLVEDIGEREFVLIGEASHGTSEFYKRRAELTKKLIETGNYQFVAVEGDWAGLYPVNQYVKHLDHDDLTARSVLRRIDRWPLWMWANEEVAEFVEWLREFNSDRPLEDRVGFYGKDVYGEWQAKRELIAFTEKHYPRRAGEVKAKLDCILPFEGNISIYIRQVSQGGNSCERQMEDLVELVKEIFRPMKSENPSDYLFAVQSAYVAKNAEAHFRKNMLGGANSWNARVIHMFETVYRLREFYGESSAGIVWAHNTHIGDARATDMFRHGQVNIGQLSREEFGREKVYAVGFSTHRGKVMAARSWESQRLVLDVPEGISESYEDIFNQVSSGRSYYFIMEENLSQNNLWINRLGHRAIGVVYNPEQEHRGNYVPTILPNRYNAMIFIPQTGPVSPLH